jgi:hypothetical protein
MKISPPFRSWHAILAIALLSTVSACAQDNTGNKPEIAAPPPTAPTSSMADHMAAGHKPKILSTTLTLSLKSETPTRLPAAGGSLSLGDKTLTLTPADLAALPHQTVTVVNGHTHASETYSGVPIAVLLARLGLPFEKKNEHILLKTYLVAEGTDGYRVILSTYETLDPMRGTGAIVADAIGTPENATPLTTEGAFKLIVPGDRRPQRWVQNLKSITFKTID